MHKRFDKERNQESLFSNAYLISSHPYNAAYRPKDKHVQVLAHVGGYGRENKDFCRKLAETPAAGGLSVVEKHVALAGPFLADRFRLMTYAGNIVRLYGE